MEEVGHTVGGVRNRESDDGLAVCRLVGLADAAVVSTDSTNGLVVGMMEHGRARPVRLRPVEGVRIGREGVDVGER